MHYLKTDGDPGAAFDTSGLNKKDANALGQSFRDNSFAFIGSNSIKQLKGILNDPNNKGVESLFVGEIGDDKEIIFKQIDVPNSERGMDYINEPPKWVDKAYTKDQQNSLFMAGHSHTEEARRSLFLSPFFDEPKNQREFLMQLGEPSAPQDYTNFPTFNRQNNSQIPLMILTPYGMTLYKPGFSPTNSQYTFYDKF